jgi:hypothetical protein
VDLSSTNFDLTQHTLQVRLVLERHRMEETQLPWYSTTRLIGLDSTPLLKKKKKKKKTNQKLAKQINKEEFFFFHFCFFNGSVPHSSITNESATIFFSVRRTVLVVVQ